MGSHDSENLCIEKIIQKLSLYFTKIIIFITVKSLHIYSRFILMLKLHVSGAEDDVRI